MRISVLLFLASLLVCSGCSALLVPEENIYTLYRNSVINPSMRIHIATFDSKDGEKYNRENCELARSLFQAQPGVTVKFWCEKGRYSEHLR